MITFLFETYLIILLTGFAAGILAVYKNKPAALYVRYLPWFLLLKFGEERFAQYWSRKYGNDHAICNIFLIIEFLFYSFTLYQLLRTSAIRKWIIYAAGMYLLLAIPLIFFIQGINYYNSGVYFMGGLMMLVFSGYYLFTLFRGTGDTNPFFKAGFWIACSILFYYCCTMPLILPWTLLLNATPFEIKILYIILLIMYCIAYAMFVIGFCFYRRSQKAHKLL
ncbi:hypothetical protein [Longitalea arenae]|uniref:hypothetical protein n=1 Tax=Longitalea arenae TaxID=2812558 RepID=UPI0019676929|nr:hypothetical protein [Longitalea arenae]